MSAVERDVSDHGPGLTDPQGHVRCEICGYRWPCPDVRANPRTLDPDERALLEVLELDVGYSVDRRLPPGAGPDMHQPGVIVGSFVDDEERKCFRVMHFHRGQRRIRVIRQDEVDPAAVGLPNSADVRAYARKLAEMVGNRRGAVAPEELEYLADALDLLKKAT